MNQAGLLIAAAAVAHAMKMLLILGGVVASFLGATAMTIQTRRRFGFNLRYRRAYLLSLFTTSGAVLAEIIAGLQGSLPAIAGALIWIIGLALAACAVGIRQPGTGGIGIRRAISVSILLALIVLIIPVSFLYVGFWLLK